MATAEEFLSGLRSGSQEGTAESFLSSFRSEEAEQPEITPEFAVESALMLGGDTGEIPGATRRAWRTGLH
jgi:hypothetical protein